MIWHAVLRDGIFVAAIVVALALTLGCDEPVKALPIKAEGCLTSSETDQAELLLAEKVCPKLRLPDCDAETMKTLVEQLTETWNDEGRLCWKAE
jgi:hypothetical protein